MPEPTRIVIVDDHPFVREGLKQLLAGQGDFVLAGEASTMEEARRTITEQHPDVAVVDLALGADDGIELVRWLRQEYPQVREEKVDNFFAGLAKRTAEVQSRCRTILQSQADALMITANQLFRQTNPVDLTLVSVWSTES